MKYLVALILLASPAAAQTPVLVIEHDYGGPTIKSGTLVRLDYEPGLITFEYRADGIFRNGFD